MLQNKSDQEKKSGPFLSKKANDIPYMDILKNSFRITWKNKFLWWFGFLISLGTFGSFNANFPTGGNSEEISDEEMIAFFQSVKNFFYQYLYWIILGIVLMTILWLVLYVLGKIARGALIKSVEEINNGKKSGFKKGFSEGKKYFWKILGLDLLLSFSLTIFLLIVITPSIILFIYKSYISGVLLLLLAILFFIALTILTSFLRNFGHIYIVLGKLNIWNAIEKSYDLFRKNLWSSILMSLVLMAVGLGLSIIFIFAIFIFLILSFLLGLLFWTIAKTIGIIIFGTIATFILLIAIFIARSALEVFYQTNWILFFKEIAIQPKAEEAIAEPVLETKIATKPSESVNLTKEN
jgi:hypothetical protein